MKKVYRTVYANGEEVVIEFRDAAFDAVKHDVIIGDGFCNAQVSAKLFQLLERSGIKTHYPKMDGETRMRTKKVETIPSEVIVRNCAVGSIVKNYPFKEVKKFFEEWGDEILLRYRAIRLRNENNRSLDKDVYRFDNDAVYENDVVRERGGGK
jgi:phosphoribosylaminoimidazole-succinocarboxamide synthase